MTVLWLLLAGGLGAVVRYLVDGAVTALRARGGDEALPVPLGTFVINVAGSLLLGLLSGWHSAGWLSSGGLLIAGTGFCGGFTTFSTASVEVARLAAERRFLPAAALAVGMAAVCVVAAAVGFIAGWAL